MRYAPIALFLLLLSCSTPPPIVEDQIERNFFSHIKDGLNDHDSYEFVSVEPLDTVYWSRAEEKVIRNNVIAFGKNTAFYDSIQQVYTTRKEAGQIDRLETKITFRANNALGAKVVNSYQVSLNKALDVTDVQPGD